MKIEPTDIHPGTYGDVTVSISAPLLTVNSAVGGLIPFSSMGANGIGIGSGALASATGAANIALGINAGSSVTTGNNNTFLGSNAGHSLTTGAANFALGASSLGLETTGSKNVGVGKGVLGVQSGASFNTAIGNGAGPDLTSGGTNTLIGNGTGGGITTGQYNTILGAGVTGLAAGLSNNIILADGQGNIKLQWDGTNLNLRGRTIVPASAATGSGLNIPPGIAPTTPVDGDAWVTTAGIFVHINGVTIGPLSGAGNVPFGFAFQRDVASITVLKPFAYFDTPTSINWVLPAGLAGCVGTLGGDSPTAPSAQTDFDIQSPVGTSIGTLRFAASSFTATFIKASPTTIAGAQSIQLVAPANLNGMSGTLFGSIVGIR